MSDGRELRTTTDRLSAADLDWCVEGLKQRLGHLMLQADWLVPAELVERARRLERASRLVVDELKEGQGDDE